MPLNKSGSKQAVSENIQTEMAAGKPQKQAVAIALNTQRRAGFASGGVLGSLFSDTTGSTTTTGGGSPVAPHAPVPGFKEAGKGNNQAFMVDPAAMLQQGMGEHAMPGFPAPGGPGGGTVNPTDILLAGLHPRQKNPNQPGDVPHAEGGGSFARPQLRQAASFPTPPSDTSYLNRLSDFFRFGHAGEPRNPRPADTIAHGFSQGTPEIPGYEGGKDIDRGFAEGGAPKRTLGVPDYLENQINLERTPGADSSGFAQGLIDAGKGVGQVVSVPVEIAKRGYDSFKNDMANIDENSQAMAKEYAGKSRGDIGWELAREAGPQLAAAAAGPLAKPATSAIARVAPRIAGAVEGILPVGAFDAANWMMSPSQAQAGEAQAGDTMPRELPSTPDGVTDVQKKLRAHGYPVKVDGKIGNSDSETSRAFQQYWREENARQQGESDRAAKTKEQDAILETAKAKKVGEERGLLEATNKAEADRLAQENLVAGNKKMDELEANKSIWSRGWQTAAPFFGLGLGALIGVGSRKGVTKFQDMKTRQRADEGDAIMATYKGGKNTLDKDLARAAVVNDFSTRGHTGFGRTQTPFLEDGDLMPPMYPNPKATPTDQLYAPQRARNALTDTAVMGTGLVDALGVGQSWLIPKFEAQRDKALAELKANPNNTAAMNAYYASENALAGAKFTGSIGYGVMGGYGAMMPKWKYSNTLPNSMSKYGGERAKLTQRFNERGYSEAPEVGAERLPSPPAEGGTLRADSTKQLPGPNTGQVPAHKAQGTVGGKTGSGTSDASPPQTEQEGFPTYPRSTSSAEPPPPTPKSRAEADAELAANKRKARSEKAAAARKAKKSASEPPPEEGFAGGGDVTSGHWNYQPRKDGRFDGPPVWPGSGSGGSDVQWPGYDTGGRVGYADGTEVKPQPELRNHHGLARGKTEPWLGEGPWGQGGYLTRSETLAEIVNGLANMAGAMPAGRMLRGPQNYQMGAKGKLQPEPRSTVRGAIEDGRAGQARDNLAYDRGIAAFEKSGPENAGMPKFERPAFAGRPDTPPLYEGEMFDPSLPSRGAHYPSYDNQQWVGSTNKPANDRLGVINQPKPGEVANITPRRDRPTDPRMDPSFQRAIDFMDRVEQGSKTSGLKPGDLNVIPGGKAPPPGEPPERAIGGPIEGTDPGRADTKPISVTSGSYVLPADVVSALGEGNTQAGMQKLIQTFPHQQHAAAPEQMGAPVPIKISDGEFVVTPDQVARIGGGDLKQGHAVLDRIVQKVRQTHIANLKSMPPPAKG